MKDSEILRRHALIHQTTGRKNCADDLNRIADAVEILEHYHTYDVTGTMTLSQIAEMYKPENNYIDTEICSLKDVTTHPNLDISNFTDGNIILPECQGVKEANLSQTLTNKDANLDREKN
jgi:hypothetical protein